MGVVKTRSVNLLGVRFLRISSRYATHTLNSFLSVNNLTDYNNTLNEEHCRGINWAFLSAAIYYSRIVKCGHFVSQTNLLDQHRLDEIGHTTSPKFLVGGRVILNCRISTLYRHAFERL